MGGFTNQDESVSYVAAVGIRTPFLFFLSFFHQFILQRVVHLRV